MPRLHGFIVSLLLAGGITAGALAATRTVHLGQAAAATPKVADSVVTARQARLDAFARSLRQAAAAEPPALPKVPTFAPVTIPTVPPPPPAPVQTASPAAPPAPATSAAPKVKHVAKLAATAPQAEPPVEYVQPPPVVQYQQAPAAPAAPTGSHEDDSYGEHEGDD